jgi:GMP synthase (glutamine-hydrolysing)
MQADMADPLGPLLVVDNGTHYLGELQRALRLIEVRFRLCRGDLRVEDLALGDASGIILTGGGVRVYQPDELEQVALSCELISSARLPILGLCLGCQLIAQMFGGTVAPLAASVDRPVDIEWICPDPLHEGVPSVSTMVMAHNDAVVDPGPAIVTLARSNLGDYEAVRHRTRPIYGLQFHPEVSGEHGRRILSNFAHLCALRNDAGARSLAV